MRYFFDVVKQHSRTYDYKGREFHGPEEAAQMAELIAVDLGISETGNWIGSQVQVKNADDEVLFSVPVSAAA
jgi:hypothetical protein